MILSIDLGSSVFKAAVFDRELIVHGEGAADVVYAPSVGALLEMPVPETEAAFHNAIAAALHCAGIDGNKLQAIAITSQAQTFTIRSSAGEARVPFISWRDTRCEAHNSAAVALTDIAQHASLDECLPLLMVAKLAFLQDESGGNLVESDDLVLMLPSWFVLQLTDAAVVDDNLASMSGLYSLQEGDWWGDALRVCNIHSRNMPQLATLGTVAGATTASAARYGLPAGIPIVLAGNDQTAGAYGARIHELDAMLITLGTAQVAYVVCDSMPGPAPGVMRGPYPGNRFYQLVADECGAGTINWALTMLPGCRNAAAFTSAAALAPADCNGVQFIADGPAGSGHWIGETARTTEADKARAVFVCLAKRMTEMLARMDPDAIRKRILVAGGGSKSDVWLACLRHQLGKSLRRVEAASPTLGAARMATAALLRTP